MNGSQSIKKNAKIKPKYLIISIGGLTLIYLLLTVITIFLMRSFLSELLKSGTIIEAGNLLVFFIIPVVLLAFFIVLVIGMILDFFSNRAGSRFQTKLMLYFVILTVLTATPMIVITNLSIREVLNFWNIHDVSAAMDQAQNFALETYMLNMEKLENLVKSGVFSEGINGIAAENKSLPAEVVTVQDFINDGLYWTSGSLIGKEELRLLLPPAWHEGIARRELPRDINVTRYIIRNNPGLITVISWHLGDNFDYALEIITAEQERFRIIDSISLNVNRVLLFYYGLFFIPTLIMTLIIAISFTHRVSSPIKELSDAIKSVAEGDFSIRLLSRKGDELSLLLKSFNTMTEDLERSQTALLKAEKESVWKSLAQQLAHEIKNPLTPIRLSAERVLRRWRNEPEKIGEILENSMVAVIQESEGISALLTEFRALSKPSEPSRTWTDIYELTEELTGHYKTTHPKLIFNIEFIKSGLLLKIDKIKLYQILSNLLINSIDSINGKGTIEIRTDIVIKRENEYCRLTIKDSGCGISEEDAAKVFAPYYTTKESGTGLGLPIVERIISDHGGAIWFNSAKGAGTTFFVDLPVAGKDE